jgi:hypothetical protein
VAAALTVHSGQAGVNAMTANRQTLLAFPGATSEIVDEYIARRDEAMANNLPIPPFPLAQGFMAGSVPVWRIHAEAFRPDGVSFVREAVVRATADPRRPFFALLWSEGERPPATDAPASPTAAAAGPAPAGSPERTPSTSTPPLKSDARRT